MHIICISSNIICTFPAKQVVVKYSDYFLNIIPTNEF